MRWRNLGAVPGASLFQDPTFWELQDREHSACAAHRGFFTEQRDGSELWVSLPLKPLFL